MIHSRGEGVRRVFLLQHSAWKKCCPRMSFAEICANSLSLWPNWLSLTGAAASQEDELNLRAAERWLGQRGAGNHSIDVPVPLSASRWMVWGNWWNVASSRSWTAAAECFLGKVVKPLCAQRPRGATATEPWNPQMPTSVAGKTDHAYSAKVP